MERCILACLLGVLSLCEAGVIFNANVNEYQDSGSWTGWFDTDNSYGEGGDWETLGHIDATYGRKCSHSVPCKAPLAMEIDFSHDHIERFPDANLTEVLECTNLGEAAKDPCYGFVCLNNDQRDFTPPAWCLRECKINGQEDTERDVPTPNCQRCANFRVRYFCLFSEYDCITYREETEINNLKNDIGELEKLIEEEELPSSILQTLLTNVKTEALQYKLHDATQNTQN